MTMNVGKQIAALKRMTVTELRRKHIEAFGEPTGSGHKDYLVKRIAWRLQAQEATCHSVPAGGPSNWPTMPTCEPRSA